MNFEMMNSQSYEILHNLYQHLRIFVSSRSLLLQRLEGCVSITLLVLRPKQSVALGRAAAVAGFVDGRGLGSVADCGAAGA